MIGDTNTGNQSSEAVHTTRNQFDRGCSHRLAQWVSTVLVMTSYSSPYWCPLQLIEAAFLTIEFGPSAPIYYDGELDTIEWSGEEVYEQSTRERFVVVMQGHGGPLSGRLIDID